MFARPPGDAVGYPSRDANLDVLPGFLNPPSGYGEVAFYWWVGDPLTKERIEWQLDTLKDKGVMGLQVNYPHSDSGGRSYGLTYTSEPPLFSEDWWNLFCWFLRQAKKRGMAVSLSDYTLGLAGQGWYIDEILRENPEICGAVLEYEIKDIPSGAKRSWELPEYTVSVVAYHTKDGNLVPGSDIDLRPSITGNSLHWQAPSGNWQVVAVFKKVVSLSLDPMNPLAGPEVIEKFYQRFEDYNPGESGKGLNFFFSDELQFGVEGHLWNDRFAEVFLKRKGYDIIPELPALFVDIGSRTPKVRLDYSDILVTLEEESYFRPIYEWHQKRGMLYGCDHGGRGCNVVEFGDYFRTQRWVTGPGNDSPRLSADVIKNKVASSITHLYQRPRTWLEGFYGSGWATTAAQVADATFRNFVMGHNLLSLHGLYYSTHGGWWEWAPPCNHFHMPYWEHMGEFLRCSERLSYLLSQGGHRCDVAIMYPLAPMQAGLDGKESVDTAFSLGTHLFSQGIDFDFMDFESLERAQVQDKELRVSGEAYRALVLPAMRAIRHSTLRKALEFYRAGGIVIALGCLSEASDRIGRDDTELQGMLNEIFGVTAKNTRIVDEIKSRRNNADGMGILAQKPEQVAKVINNAFTRDFLCLSETFKPRVLHRRIGPRDVYMIYGAPKNSECFYRAKGKVELWDPWTGQTRALYITSQTAEGTKVRMPLDENEVQLVAFNPDEPYPIVAETDLDEVLSVVMKDDKLSVQGIAVSAGRKTATIRWDGKSITATGEAHQPSQTIYLDCWWEFELKPSLDNRWGDYRLPAFNGMIGAEARNFRYAEETSPDPGWQDPQMDDSNWTEVTYSYGPHFWKLGPLPENIDPTVVEAQLADLSHIDPTIPVEINGKHYLWKPYEFSMRWGVEGDPGRQGYHGLKGEITDDFIALGKLRFTSTSSVYEKEDAGSRYYLWTSVAVDHEERARVVSGGMEPAKVWLNGSILGDNAGTVRLKPGSNPLLLRYDRPGRAHLVLESTDAPKNWRQTHPLAMRWYNRQGILPFNTRPQDTQPAGWYRFTSPPGLRAITVISLGAVQAWADGIGMNILSKKQRKGGSQVYRAAVSYPTSKPVTVALRIEQDRCHYGGAALPEPVGLDCVPGTIRLGDWAQIDGLASYSGGAWYRKTVEFSQEQVEGQVTLNMGNVVATAEVHVNGQLAGIKVASPWKVDISKFVKPGENRIEILVYNTLMNHYLTIPTRYRGSPVSGLIGPASIEVSHVIELKQCGKIMVGRQN